ncbi:hypothetical protein M407DRAFT_4187 [Tulasnella calospora MUT 4182]|uniref:Uncharacterized protein n=1 Tax=Tulasnella calospora MUT 4182 TaxID=1051891 RepID=A0A0C3MGV3_9AGAM|nr:hypothetical protein M407DRAFT_4187 [Tulasnella calospora MUT 4182]
MTTVESLSKNIVVNKANKARDAGAKRQDERGHKSAKDQLGTVGYSQLFDLDLNRKANLGRGRKIWNHHVLVHKSVKLRMEHAENNYIPAGRSVGKDSDVKFVDDFGDEVVSGQIYGKCLVSFVETRGSNASGQAGDQKISTINEVQGEDDSDSEKGDHSRSPTLVAPMTMPMTPPMPSPTFNDS